MSGSKKFESEYPPIPEFVMKMFGLEPGLDKRIKELEKEKEAFPLVDHYIENINKYKKLHENVVIRDNIIKGKVISYERPFILDPAKRMRAIRDRENYIYNETNKYKKEVTQLEIDKAQVRGEFEKIRQEWLELIQKLPPDNSLRKELDPMEGASVDALKQRSDEYKKISLYVTHCKNIKELDLGLLSKLQNLPIIKAATQAIKSNIAKQATTGETKESKRHHNENVAEEEKLSIAEKIENQFKNFQILMKLIPEVPNKYVPLLSVSTYIDDEDQLNQLNPLLEGNRVFTDSDKSIVNNILMKSLLNNSLGRLEKAQQDSKPNLFAAYPDLEESCNLLILALLNLKDEDLTREERERLDRIANTLGGTTKFALLLEGKFEKLTASTPSLSEKFNNQESALLTRLSPGNEIYAKRLTPKG